MEFSFIDFLNSDWHDWRGSGAYEDRLYRADWLRSFLDEWKLTVNKPVDERVISSLVALRSLIRRMTEAIVDKKPIADEDIAGLNEFLKPSSLKRQLVKKEATQSYRLELQPEHRDWSWVQAEIAASFATLLSDYDLQRLKICQNEDCKWVFYDSSRNRSQQWCEENTCASLMRVRRFRARVK